jgi:hypothetical protein
MTAAITIDQAMADPALLGAALGDLRTWSDMARGAQGCIRSLSRSGGGEGVCHHRRRPEASR